MHLRFLAFLIAAVCALLCAATAAAYPWPVRPFNRPHPVRANFGDPRTVFSLNWFQDGIDGPGSFLFHNGVDISAPDGTKVYPVMSGVVHVIDAEALSVDTGQGRIFQYYHIVPRVSEGQQVVAQKTVLGTIARGYEHVHLSEIRGTEIWNPLSRGGLAPYFDHTRPWVSSITFRAYNTTRALDPLGVCGRLSVVAAAYDRPAMKVTGDFATFPVTPALIRWTLRRIRTGAVVIPLTTAVDFRQTLPLDADFWRVYARGTYQNDPRFGSRQFGFMPGTYLFQLTPDGLDTKTLPNGVYELTVHATDTRGNTGSLNQRFTVLNTATPTGCPVSPRP